MEIASAENVLHFIYVLYNNPDKVEKEKASKWLEEFQKSVSIGILLITSKICAEISRLFFSFSILLLSCVNLCIFRSYHGKWPINF